MQLPRTATMQLKRLRQLQTRRPAPSGSRKTLHPELLALNPHVQTMLHTNKHVICAKKLLDDEVAFFELAALTHRGHHWVLILVR